MIHWIPDKLANPCIHDTTRKYRDTRDQRGAQEMLDYQQRFLGQALQLETCLQGASQRASVWHRRYTFCCVYATQL
jgi:hypothetical protein